MDAGSNTYEGPMVKVLVLHPKDLTNTEKTVIEQSLKSMIGLYEEHQDVAESQVADSAADLQVVDSADQERSLQGDVKKRRLYQRTSDESMVWFPHDNHPDLLKEFVWESGNPRRVLHGTPASGAGILGCLEAGVSVIALCEDIHHETTLSVAVKERCVEAMLAGSRVFKGDDLQARAPDICPSMPSMENNENHDEKDDKEGPAREREEKDNKEEKDNNDMKGNKVQHDKKVQKYKTDRKANHDEKDNKDNKCSPQTSNYSKKAENNKGAEPSAGSPNTISSNSSEGGSGSSISYPSDHWQVTGSVAVSLKAVAWSQLHR
ncbi:hypothetical protein N9L68_07250 [bacterium]|nr:hypothetical protein [bacterium]